MKNKKLLLVATAAIALVAASTAGVSTFAWLQAGSAADMTAKSGASGQVGAANGSVIAALDLYVPCTFTVSTNVELTNSANGQTKVISGGAIKDPTNESALVKSAIGSLTFSTTGLKIGNAGGASPTEDQLKLAFGHTSSEVSKVFNVKISASNLVRIGISTSAGAWASAGAANTSTNSYVGAYSADTKVTIGKVTLKYNGGTNLSGVVYAHLDDDANKAAVQKNDVLANYFYYSISPSLTGTTAESGVEYGVVSAYLEA